MHQIWEQIQKFAPDIDRESEFGQTWLKGMHALSRAQDEGGRLAFAEASEAFVAAIRAQAERAEAWMGLAYLLVLLGDELSAVHYAREAQDRQAGSEAHELIEMLESSHRINTLLEDVEKLSQGLGLREPRAAERIPAADAAGFVDQTEQLLMLQHDLLETELKLGLFKRIEQLHSRQRCLETLFEMLSAHLAHFLAPEDFARRLQTRLEVLSFDLESLQNLENLFDELRRFQKDVKAMFRELTRHMIQLRMKKELVLPESLQFLQTLKADIQAHGQRLDAFPTALRYQVESASGWSHLVQQADQLNQLIDETILAVG